MAVLLSRAQQAYSVGTFSVTPTLPAGKTEIRASFTRVAWPVGKCLTLTYYFPDGTLAGNVSFDGGNTLDKQGQPLSHVGLRKVGGLPAGQYRVDVEIHQAITTAVTVQDV